MKLTNEEKKRIGDAATIMMQAFCEFKMAEDRMSTASTICGNLAGIAIPKDVFVAGIKPYADSFINAQKVFREELGVGDDNTEFWEWNKKQPPSME